MEAVKNFYYDVTDVQNLVSSDKFVHWEEVQKVAQPADLIEFCRGPYNHWAMYSEEDGKVYNICAESKENTTAPIKLQSLKYVAELGPSRDRQRCRVNNKDGFRGLYPMARTSDRKALPTKESIKMARKVLDTSVKYNFTGKNCEYYCTKWKFGKGFTDQSYTYEFSSDSE